MSNPNADSAGGNRAAIHPRERNDSGNVLNRIGRLGEIWRVHFIVALVVGLVLGTCIGIGEGIWVLLSEGLFGRYNELIAWAIAFDAPTMVAVEFGLAIISGLFFSIMQVVPTLRRLVSLQLAESAFVLALAAGVWSRGTADPSTFDGNPLVLMPPAALGLLSGGLVLVIVFWITEHIRFFRRLKLRYWLLLEAVVVAIAIAFGFSH